MTDIVQFVIRHGYVLVFLWLLAEQAALPIPSMPLLLVSGALVRTGELKASLVVMYALTACLIADNVWFHIGRRYGGRALQFICKISLEPDSCVRRTENLFVKYGLRSLLLSKFIPGLNVVAAPLAGGSGANFGQFLFFESVGALIWITSYVFAGYIFADELELAVRYAMRMGFGVVVIAILVLTSWILWRAFQRYRFLKSVNIARISAEELDDLLSTGTEVAIVDVRSGLGRDGSSIPGAVWIPTEELAVRHGEIPRNREIVLFCT